MSSNSAVQHDQEPNQTTTHSQHQNKHCSTFNGNHAAATAKDAPSHHFEKRQQLVSCKTVGSNDDLDDDLNSEDLDEEERQQLNDVKEYDPQIRLHLEELNRFATKINQLEKCVEEENSKFQKILNESSVQLKKLARKIGERVVSEARPYYEATQKLKSLQISCQKAAIKFEKYNELHTEAKQAIADTELLFHKEEEKRKGVSEGVVVVVDANFDHSWQEKLNQANINFIEARLKRQQYEDEHMAVMTEFRLLEAKVITLLKKHKNAIKKSKVYFDESTVYDCKRKAIKENIEQLGEELVESKRQYAKALKGLESISEEIHEKRSQILAKSLVREPGVGAELAATFLERDSFENGDTAVTLSPPPPPPPPPPPNSASNSEVPAEQISISSSLDDDSSSSSSTSSITSDLEAMKLKQQ